MQCLEVNEVQKFTFWKVTVLDSNFCTFFFMYSMSLSICITDSPSKMQLKGIIYVVISVFNLQDNGTVKNVKA